VVVARVEGAGRKRKAEPLRFTTRERDVVGLLRQGLRRRDIASRLGVGDETVKQHLKGVYDKLGVGSRWDAILALRGDR
jgi:LuxR family maltose regulon positive regulatory protein